MRKLILSNYQSPGDLVMLTAAVRDLHLRYPGESLTEVRSPCPQLWENNPYLTPLEHTDSGVEVVECEYLLIHRSNHEPWHFLHGFIHSLNGTLGLDIQLTEYTGDVHLAECEKRWDVAGARDDWDPSPVLDHQSGWKARLPIKWWDHARYQAVVDCFRGRILFVQVGEAHH